MELQVIEAVIERTSLTIDPSQRNGAVYGIGRLVGRGPFPSRSGGARTVLARLENPKQTEVVLDAKRCIAVPPSVESSKALLAPPLGVALWMWDQLNLELGEPAVYTEGDVFAPLVGQVALWRGGCPVIQLTGYGGSDVQSGIEVLPTSDPEKTARDLRGLIKGKPGFAAVDLSGRPEVIDVFFEVVPQWGRMMLAGGSRSLLTVDFYNNVHRKGVTLLTSFFDPTRVFHEIWGTAYLASAFRILEKTEMANICMRLTQPCGPHS